MTGTLSTVGRQYTYDTAGNILTETKGGNTVNYTYDPFGNILSVMMHQSIYTTHITLLD